MISELDNSGLKLACGGSTRTTSDNSERCASDNDNVNKWFCIRWSSPCIRRCIHILHSDCRLLVRKRVKILIFFTGCPVTSVLLLFLLSPYVYWSAKNTRFANMTEEVQNEEVFKKLDALKDIRWAKTVAGGHPTTRSHCCNCSL